MKFLRDTHPTAVKIEKIFSLMNELGIMFEACDYGVMRVYDSKVISDEKSTLKIILKETTDSDSISPSELPPTFEYVMKVE